MKLNVVFSLLFIAAIVEAKPLIIYMAVNGNDRNPGLSCEKPILTIARAQTIIQSEIKEQHKDVQIIFGSGIYYSQSVRWISIMPDHSITFASACDKNPSVFDGDGHGAWFIFSGHSDGAKTNLIFNNIQIQNYSNAIQFSGNIYQTKSSSRKNIISGCRFLDIGEDGYAAVSLHNSSENIIENNHFISIKRTDSCGLVHAIYASHGSSDNLITKNVFQECCGDPIRFRDGSNNNVVEGNRFIRTGINAAVSDWYCNHDKWRNNCTKKTAECPSWNNLVRDNQLETFFNGDILKATFTFSTKIPSGCSKPSPESERFIVSGNYIQ
jgi:hypothetical protein